MGGQKLNIQWFPGHMTKTLRELKDEVKNVDLVIELLDSRIPKSSKNPELAAIISNKPHVLALNKADVADPEVTAEWLEYYKSKGYGALAISSLKPFTKELFAAVDLALKDKLRSKKDRGMTGIKPKAVVVGIPNVGKSTFINHLAKTRAARVEDRPGVTRGKQWISTEKIELLDMPGVLWPKFDDEKTMLNLAFTGAIKDSIVDIRDVASYLLLDIATLKPSALEERYKIAPSGDGYSLLTEIAKSRGMLMRRGEFDLERAAATVLDELRAGKLGSISLERPNALQW